MRPRARLVSVLLAVCATAVSGPAAASSDGSAIPSQATVTLTGHGYGHGHGMSQYGARGAARQGLSWRQILGFYYPGTDLARAGGHVRVLITADTTPDVSVDAQPGLHLHRLGGRSTLLGAVRPKAGRWRLVPTAEGTVVDYRLRGSRDWQRLMSFAGAAEFTATGQQPITLRLPHRGAATYRGTLRAVDGQTVNVVSMDAYLRGVVPSEMPSTWEPQAVRAQAVAARSYAAFERAAATGAYDVCDTTACQVYGGVAVEQPGSDRAVRRTTKRIVEYKGAPAFTQFSSSDGGWNAVGSAPYLVAQTDPYEASSENPYATWAVDLSDADIERAFPVVGDVSTIAIGERDGNGEWGGRVGTVTLSGGKGSLTVTGDAFRAALGLRSTWFTIGAVSADRPAR